MGLHSSYSQWTGSSSYHSKKESILTITYGSPGIHCRVSLFIYLLIILDKVLIEGRRFTDGSDIQVLISRVHGAKLLLAHSGGSEAEHTVTHRGEPPGIGAGREDIGAAGKRGIIIIPLECNAFYSVISIARQGAPSHPPSLTGAAYIMYSPSGTSLSRTPSRTTISFSKRIR